MYKKIIFCAVLLFSLLSCGKDSETAIEYLEFNPEIIIPNTTIPVKKTVSLTIKLNNKLLSSEQSFDLIYTPQVKTSAILKVSSTIIKERESHKFISKTSNDILQIDISNTQEETVPFELSITAGGKVTKKLNTTLSFIAPDKELKFDIIEYPTPQTGKETPLNIKVIREKYQGVFPAVYNLLKGSGTLYNVSTEVKPNSSLNFKNNVLHSLKYTPASPGEHELSFSIDNEGDIFLGKILIDVPVHISTQNLTPEAGTVTGAGTYKLNSKCTLTSTANKGYLFSGYFIKDKQLSKDNTYEFVAENDLMAEARFVKNIYNISIIQAPTDAAEVTITGKNQVGEEITIAALPKPGYLFNKFQIGETEIFTNPYKFVYGTSDTQITAFFKLKQSKVSFESSTGGTLSSTGDVYNYGENIESTATPDNGYKFFGWYQESVFISADPTLKIKVGLENEVYTALFKRAEYVLSVSPVPAEGGTVTGSGTYYYNDLITLTASPNSGYTFTHYDINGSKIKTNPHGFNMANENTEIVCVFNKIKHTVSFTSGVGGTVSNEGSMYEYGEIIRSTALAEQNMKFVGWYKNNALFSSSATIEVKVGLEDEIYEARFESNLNNIILFNEHPTFGTITGGGIFTSGTEVTITATPNTHYHLQGWYENDNLTTTANPFKFTVDKNRMFTSKFARNEHTVKTIPGTGYSISFGGKYLGGETAKFNLNITKDYKLIEIEGISKSNYNSTTGEIIINNISQDYTITPSVRYNIIQIFLTEIDGKIGIVSSINVPGDTRVSVITNYGIIDVNILKGEARGVSEYEYYHDSTIEYVSMPKNDGYEIRY